jgi:hypothetical protein
MYVYSRELLVLQLFSENSAYHLQWRVSNATCVVKTERVRALMTPDIVLSRESLFYFHGDNFKKF